MKAVQINSHGSAEVLQCKEIEEPICTSNKVKINVKASSVNHLDILVRIGIPCLEIPLTLVMGSDDS